MSYTNVEREGPPGAEGKSAYQIWLELGNVGTEQDFIDSLKGDSAVKSIDTYTVFATSGNVINIPNFDFSYLAFRGNIHLVKNAPTFGFSDNGSSGITLTEPIDSTRPGGGEYISVIFNKTN